MHILELSMTSRCNRSCAYCVAARTRRNLPLGEAEKNAGKSQDMDMGKIKEWIIFQRKYWGDTKIILTGGEPTMHPEWIGFLIWIKEQGFEKPLLYTNGYGLRELMDLESAKEYLNIVLACHGNYEETRINVELLKELGVNFIVKLLVWEGSPMDMMREYAATLGCSVKFEGIRLDLEGDMGKLKGVNVLAGESPYHWRWNGYGDLIDRERTPWREAYIISVIPVGEIFGCHLYDEPLGSIDEPKELRSVQCAGCMHLDTMEMDPPGGETRCETLHYVNLFYDAREG